MGTLTTYNHTTNEAKTQIPDEQKQACDPFNPEALRLPQTFESVGVKKVLLTIPVRKPDRQIFIQVHPDPNFALDTCVLELKEDREIYLISPALHNALSEDISLRRLVTAITRQGDMFLWPLRLPSEDGRLDNWSQSALEACEIAKSRWLRIRANLNLGSYECRQALGDIPAPEWPDMSFRDILAVAFKGKYIDNLDHPVLKRLRGES